MESEEIAEVSPKGRYVRVMSTQYSKLLRSSGVHQVYLGLDKDTGRQVHWHLIQLAGVSASEKERFVSQAEKLKVAKHPNLASTLAVWAVRGREMAVMISSHEGNDTLASVTSKVFSEKLRLWGPQILRAIEYLQECKATPIRMNRQSILITDDKAILEDVIMLPGKSDPEEELLRRETDVISFAVLVLEAFLPEIAPISITDILGNIRENRVTRLLDRVTDDSFRDILSHCLCPISTRFSIHQVLEHFALKGLDTISPVFPMTSPQTCPSHNEMFNWESPRKTVPLSLIIEMDDVKVNVFFHFKEGEDSPDRVAEELLRELKLSERFLTETAAAISRKLQERSSRHIQYRDDLEDPPRMERSTSVLYDTVKSIKPVRSGSDLKTPDTERSISRKSTGKTVNALGVYLKKGLESNEISLVKQMQERLGLVLKEEIKADGQFGKKTENMVKRFQEQEGLTVTGAVDTATWTALMTQFNRLWTSESQD